MNTGISESGDYADDDNNDGVAAMSVEEDEIGDSVDEVEGDLGDAANDAMEEDEDDDAFTEPAANDESSSDHPRVAKEPDYGNTLPLHSLPPQLFDGPEALAKAIDSMDRDHMEDLIRQAQAAVKDLENIGACLCCDFVVPYAKTELLSLMEEPPKWLNLLRDDDFELDQINRDYYTVKAPGDSLHATAWASLIASPRALVPDTVADKLHFEKDNIAICRTCYSALKHRKVLPKFASKNDLAEIIGSEIPELSSLSQNERMLLNTGGRSFTGLHTYYLLPSGTADVDGTIITRPKV